MPIRVVVGRDERTDHVTADRDIDALVKRLVAGVPGDDFTGEILRHIVRVARFFEANKTAYMVLEYERGQSLKSWRKKRGDNIDEKTIVALLAPLWVFAVSQAWPAKDKAFEIATMLRAIGATAGVLIFYAL